MLERRDLPGMDPASAPGVRTGWSHPEWCVVAAPSAAWVLMARMPAPRAGHAGHPPPGGAPDADALSSAVMVAAVMVTAMMLPLVIPHVRHLAASAPRPRRPVAAFLLGYLAVWIAAQAAIVRAFGGMAALTGWAWAAGAVMVAAAAWELAPMKRRHLLRCHRMAPLRARGWRLDRDSASFGASTGVACVGACWALMAACAAFGHGLPLMAVLFGVQVSGRYRPARPPALAALLVLGACLLSIAARLAGGRAA